MKKITVPTHGQVDLEFHELMLTSKLTFDEIGEYFQSLIDSGVAYRLHGWPLAWMAQMRLIGYVDHRVPIIENGFIGYDPYPEDYDWEFDPDPPRPPSPEGSMH